MSSGEASPADESGGEFGEAFMHEQVTVPADGEAFELVEMCDGLFDYPPDGPEPDDLLAAALRDDRLDTFGAQPVAERLGVVAAVGQDHLGSATRAADPSGHGRYRFDKVLSGLDVGHIPCGGDDRERDACRIAGDVVFRARAAAIYW